MSDPGLRHPALLAGILLLALGLRLWAIDFGLPYAYHTDESALIRRVLAFGTGDLNPHAFHWPAFHLYLLFALYGLLYVGGAALGIFESARDFGALYFTDPTIFFLTGRLLSALLGTATVYLAYRIGREIEGPATGLFAALLLAVTYYHVRDSHLTTLDVPATFWLTLSFLFAVRLFRDPAARIRPYLLAGLAAGLAAGVKYNAAIACLAIAGAHFLRPAPRRFGHLAAAGAVSIGAFLVTNPFVILDAPTFLRDFLFQQQHLAEGMYGIATTAAWSYYLEKMLLVDLQNSRMALFDPLALYFVAGFVALAFHRPRREAALLAIIPGVYLLYIGTWGMAATRYLNPAFPLLAVAAGVLLARAPTGVRVAGVVLLALPLHTVATGNYILSGTDTRTEAKHWIEANVPSGTKIAIETNAPPLRRSPENLARRAHLLTSGTVEHPTQTAKRIREYYDWRARHAGPVSYDIERLNDNLVDADRVLENRMPNTNYDVTRLRELGVRYVILSSRLRAYLRDPEARRLYPRIARFYEELGREARLVQEFEPGRWQPGPEIRIYALDAAP